MANPLDASFIAEELPSPRLEPPERRRRFSVVWVVPIVAVITAIVLLVRSLLSHGPTITIAFESAEGIEADKTEVRYKNVIVGRVSHVALSHDHAHVIATVDLTRNASSLAVEDTKFWVERPRLGVGGVSGISTLISGAYIGVDIGVSTVTKKHFVGLERPPAFLHDQRGRTFVLTSSDPGSLSDGSPVYYRRIQVGAISSLDLMPDGKRAELHVFVRAPYDRFVTTGTHFWNSSGVDLSLSSQGLKLDTESIATVLTGGVSFQADDGDTSAPAAENASFVLYNDKAAAFAPPTEDPLEVRMRFDGDARGVAIASPIELRGVTLGSVTAVKLALDPKTQDFHTDVVATIYPSRMGPAYDTIVALGREKGLDVKGELQSMVDERGLHAQIRSTNPFIGPMYIALDFFKGSRGTGQPLRDPSWLAIPTEPGTADEIENELRAIVKKLDSIPFEEIGANLRDTLKSASSVMQQLDKDIAPEARGIFQSARAAIKALNQNVAAPDSELQVNTRETLVEIKRAAASLRILAEYLDQHPESIVRGRGAPAEPQPAGSK